MSSTCITAHLTNPNGLFYFNGSGAACPIISETCMDYEKVAMDILKGGLHHYSLNELKDTHFKQMEMMESTLSQVCDGGMTTPTNIDNWVHKMKMDISRASILWYTNVYNCSFEIKSHKG